MVARAINVPLACGRAAVAVLLQGLDLDAQRVRDHPSGCSRLVAMSRLTPGQCESAVPHQKAPAVTSLGARSGTIRRGKRTALVPGTRTHAESVNLNEALSRVFY